MAGVAAIAAAPAIIKSCWKNRHGFAPSLSAMSCSIMAQARRCAKGGLNVPPQFIVRQSTGPRKKPEA